MIIIDPSEDTPNSPGERSPLKGGEFIPTTAHVTPPPPPPYASPGHTPSGPPQFYQAVSYQPHHPHPHAHHPHVHHPHPHPHHPHDPHHSRHSSPDSDHFHGRRQRRRRSPFRRFIKAFSVAVLVLFLWFMFLESLDAGLDIIDKVGGKKDWSRRSPSSALEWVDRWYRKPEPAVHQCPCLPEEVPTTPGRVLPILYPPIVPQPEPL